MTTCTLHCNGKCELSIAIDIHGFRQPITVLVDTGFVSGRGYGLKIPIDLALHANHVGTAEFKMANGVLVDADTIEDAKIVEIEGHQLDHPMTIPAIFMGGDSLIGMKFIQKCILQIDGPNKQATIQF